MVEVMPIESPVSVQSNGDVCMSLVNKMNNLSESRKPWFSLEFFAPSTQSGCHDLISLFDHFLPSKPLFYSLVWKHRDPDTIPTLDRDDSKTLLDQAKSSYPAIGMADVMLNYSGLSTLLHITCAGQTKQNMRMLLAVIQDMGIRNLLALFGDLPYDMQVEDIGGDFRNCAEFVSFIKTEFPGVFCVAVAGHPSGHPSLGYQASMQMLKKKVDNGADFVLSQIIFDANQFISFYRSCRSLGIKCPIIASVFPIATFEAYNSIVRSALVPVPETVAMAVNLLKNNDEQVEKFGVSLACSICRQLLTSGLVFGLHFSTMNRRTAVTEILTELKLGLESTAQSLTNGAATIADKQRPDLPWRQSAKLSRHMQESVRPIFWSVRPKSYFQRTADWEQFPNGRWGSPTAASFRDIDDHYLTYYHWDVKKSCLLDQWGHNLRKEEDVWTVFASFLSGRPHPETGTLVVHFPWCDSGKLSAETDVIADDLVKLNELGVLTINSQPNVNGLPSTHAVHGWGPPGGFVYQKAYLEFFMPTKYVGSLLTILRQYPSVSYHIINKKDKDGISNHEKEQSIAVTWGVYPGRQVMQPTVVDSLSFKIWKNEAYDMWIKRWAVLYEETSESYKLLENITNTYSLINLVDNDYPNKSCLFELMKKMISYEHREYNDHQVFAV